MKILVTGGTGFIGSHFLAKLGAEHEVLALRRKGSTPAVAVSRDVNWMDVAMDSIEASDIRGIDVCVHFASAGVSPKKAGWEEMFHLNVNATVKLIQACHAAGVRRMVAAGTFAEYGASADRYAAIPADAPLLPTDGYAASKAAGCMALVGFASANDMELSYLRIFSAYGEGQYERSFWPALRAAAREGRDFEMSGGEQIRDYIPVTQVADRFVEAATAMSLRRGHPLIRNVGTGRPVMLRDFARHWWSEWQATGELRIGAIPYRPGDLRRFVAAQE